VHPRGTRVWANQLDPVGSRSPECDIEQMVERFALPKFLMIVSATLQA